MISHKNTTYSKDNKSDPYPPHILTVLLANKEKYKTFDQYAHQIGRTTKVKQHTRVHQPYIRAKLFGGVLIAIGGALLSFTFFLSPNPLDPLLIKLAFTALLIGAFMMLLITEQTIPRRISNAQIEGNLVFVNKMTKNLKLAGNAVFLPKSQILSEERIYIPVEKTTGTHLPFIDDEMVLNLRSDGEVLGISVPPSGLTLLKKIQAEVPFDRIGLENVEEKLQTFVGLNILKSVTLKKEKNGWKLELERLEACTTEQPTCAQYPCSACSAVLTAITQAAQEKIWVQETSRVGNKTIFHLKIGGVTCSSQRKSP